MAVEESQQGPSFIVYGPTGSGLSEALKAFRTNGLLTMAGVPLAHIERYLMLAETDHKAVAITPEINPYDMTPEAAQAHLSQLQAKFGDKLKLFYLSTATEKLVQRFVDKGARHAYEKHSLLEAVEQEQLLYQSLKSLSDYHVDTGTTTNAELAFKVAKVLGIQAETPPLEINLVSFGFKRGVPLEAELVFDMRFLPNPFYIEALRPYSGLDKPVADYVLGFPEAQQFVTYWKDLLTHILPLYQNQGKVRLTIGIGCTGGQHRSVALTELIAKELKAAHPDFVVRIIHREQSHWPQPNKSSNAAPIN